MVNENDGFISEITPRGKQLAKVLLDNTGGPPPGNGPLFGVTFDPLRGVPSVNDGGNTLNSLNWIFGKGRRRTRAGFPPALFSRAGVQASAEEKEGV